MNWTRSVYLDCGAQLLRPGLFSGLGSRARYRFSCRSKKQKDKDESELACMIPSSAAPSFLANRANEISQVRSKQPVHERAIPWCRARWLDSSPFPIGLCATPLRRVKRKRRKKPLSPRASNQWEHSGERYIWLFPLSNFSMTFPIIEMTS